jgi:hypothetical protein
MVDAATRSAQVPIFQNVGPVPVVGSDPKRTSDAIGTVEEKP